MPKRLPLSRRISTAARWPLGVVKTGWDYLWRTTPMHRTDEAGSAPADLPPPLPAGTDLTALQGIADGVGPLLHRRYAVRVKDATSTAEELIARFGADPNCASPTSLASFVKLHGAEGRLCVGDEFTVRMPGPWDGPVRTIESAPVRFAFATLDGHLEAGRIQFSARDLGAGRLEVEIEAWARGGDPLSNLLFDRLRVNKEVQLHMWTSVLEQLLELSGGRRDGRVAISTRRVDPAELTGGAALADANATARSASA